MPDLTPAEIEVLRAFDDALDAAKKILLPELPNLLTQENIRGRIEVVSSDVYGRICGEREIEVDEEQLKRLQTALTLLLDAAKAREGAPVPESLEVDELVSNIVEVLGADPAFRESQDIEVQTSRAMTILGNLQQEFSVEVSEDDRMAFAAMVQTKWLRVHDQIPRPNP